MDNALVAFACGAGLVGIDSRNQDQLILYLFVDTRQTVHIIADGVLVVGGAGPDDDKEFIAFSGKHITDFSIPRFLYACKLLGKREHFTNFCGSR